ncbi:MAG: hypothetical protein HWE18_08460 [Gammaproteobacteria bacterium]|nr:hypothetical protein [Gammaproteobacteria bacterium]
MPNINPMVSTIVQQIMVTENDTAAWRRELIRNHIFDAQEAKDLSEREISLIHHALLTQRFSQMSSDELLQEAKKQKLQYHVQLETDQFQMGAVCY